MEAMTDCSAGQGPYFGQAAWFARFHPERIQSATDRYVNEMERVIGVIDRALQHSDWLVGDKCSYADLSFVTWAEVGKGIFIQLNKADIYDKYPNYVKWADALKQRASVSSALEHIAAERKAHGLPP